ncbi:hypothetical protein ACH5RR_039257 [Cinchona calisaya]|uniref:Uncharacterized protein n=1 Tax=Cinchona calisaya TaxID=153742 RepID=A0ABD2Y368_9GENT
MKNLRKNSLLLIKVLEECATTIIFYDKNLLLGTKAHNRPLFINGYAREQKVNRILLNGGSAVNIMPLHAMKEFRITSDELLQSRLMIQGFNQGGKEPLVL